ncbi:MAG: hypothetical protein H6728_06885 [Myxococcales bacterium]|nr:hypothetical protein [Myxococcales bacterium]
MPRIDRPNVPVPQRSSSSLDNNEKLGRLLDADPQIKTHQDLINHLYAKGDGSWDGASKAARDLGINMNDLLGNRQATLARNTPAASNPTNTTSNSPLAPSSSPRPVNRFEAPSTNHDTLLGRNTPPSSTTNNLSTTSPSRNVRALALESLAQPTVTSLRDAAVSTVSGLQSVSQNLTGGVSPDPLSLVGQMKDGNIQMSVPLTKEMINSGAIKLGNNARADVSFVVKDGKIDFSQTRVDLKDVKALGLVKVKGLEIDRNGKLRADTIFKPNITKQLLGADRVPQTMEGLSQVLQTKMAQTPPNANGISLPDNIQVNAQNVSLRTDRPISLGGGNLIDLKEGTRVNIQGSLSHAVIEGRGGIDQLKLQGNGSQLDMGPGQVAFRADVQRSADGQIRADLQLNQADVSLRSLQHQGRGERLQVEGAGLRNGQVRAQINIGADGKPQVGGFNVQGELAANSVQLEKEGKASLSARDLRATLSLSEDGRQVSQGPDSISLTGVDATVDRMSLQGANGDQVQVQGSIENASFGQARQPGSSAAQPYADIPHFQGTVSGKIQRQQDGRLGEISLNEATASGSLRTDGRGVIADVELGRVDTSVKDIAVAHGGNSVDIREGSLTGKGGVSLGQDGLRADAEGRLRGELRDGQIGLGDLGRVDLADGTKADLQVDRAKVGPQGIQDLSARGTVNLGLDDGRIRLNGLGEVDIASGTKADIEVLSSTLGPNLKEGSFSARGRIQGGLDNGSLKIGDAASVDLRGTRFDLDLKSIEKGSSDALPSLRGDMKLETELEVGLKQALRTRLGDAAVKDVEGRVALDLKDVQVDGQGRVNVEHAGVQLDAKIGEISGKINLDPQALRPAAGGTSATTDLGQVAKLDASKPVIDQPLAIDPMSIAKRIQNGDVDVELPIQEAGIEDAAKILGLKTLDVAPGTKLIAKLHVEDGRINYEKSSIRLNKPIEALGMFDLNLPRINKDGKVVVGVMGKDINITKWVLGQDRLPSRVSNFVDEASTWQKSSSGGPVDIQKTLDSAGRFASLGGLSFKAQGVSLAPGRLQIGDNDYIELDGSNRVDIQGNAQNVSIKGELPADKTFIDVGGSRLDIAEGRVQFEANVKTGLSRTGRLDGDSEIDVRLNIPKATVNELYHERDNGDRFHLQSGEIQDASLHMQHRFHVQNDGSIKSDQPPQLDLSVGRFAGKLGDSQITLRNPDGTPATMTLQGAEASGTLSANADGIAASLDLASVQASLRDLDLDAAGQKIVDLDGNLSGKGRLSLDPRGGFSLDGDFQLDGKVQDARIQMGNDMDLDLSANSQASIALRKLGFGPQGLRLDGDLTVDAGLDRGMMQVGDRPPLRFDRGSNLRMSTTLKHDELGPSMTLNGHLQAKLAPGQSLGAVETSRGTLEASLDGGTADINLGDITLQPDGAYKIKDPSIALRLDLGKLAFHQ